jgi:hypothetical protein
MRSLADFSVQSWYANEIFTLHNNWNNLAENQRRREYERIFNALCQTANIPLPSLTWIETEGGGFTVSRWAMEVELNAVRLNPKSETKNWASAATTLYHETRHAEQNFLVIIALIASKLPLPVTNSKAIQPGGDLPTRVSATLGIPINIALQARINKSQFSDNLIPTVREWLDSKFGRYGKQFDHVMENSDKSGKMHGAYRNLPTEADAYRIEKQVKDLLKNLINSQDKDEALSLLQSFF